MFLSVTILSPEGWTEGIHVTQPHTILFDIQLTTTSQHCLLGEEVLFLVDHSGFVLQCLDILDVILHHGGDLEQFTRSLAVRSGDDWGVDLQEAVLVEEFMCGLG